MKVFHGTSEQNYNSIMQQGFKISHSDDGRWGTGIYLSDNIETALTWGKSLIEKTININEVLNITYHEIAEMFPELSSDDEEGTSQLKGYVLNNTNYKAVSIQYEDGEKELVVYDEMIVN